MKKKVMLYTTAVTMVASTLAFGTVGHSAEKTKDVVENATSFAPAYFADSTSEINEKMLNSVDFYHDVQGKVIYSLNGFQKEYEFVIEQGNRPSSYVKVVNVLNQEVESESYSDGIVNTQYYSKHNQKVEQKSEKQSLTKEQKSAKERHYKNNNKENFYKYRLDPSDASQTVSAVFPQTFAFWMDDFDKNYSVVGTETVLGREATVVEGKMPSILDQKRKAKNFKFWVDTQTGILLKSTETDENGNVINSIEMKELVVDKGVKLDKAMLKMSSDAKDLAAPEPVKEK